VAVRACRTIFLVLHKFIWSEIPFSVTIVGLGPMFFSREFVNSVWCIKILSPQDVQQMVRGGGDLLSTTGVRTLQGSVCDDYSAGHDMQNLTGSIAPVVPLDY
jgi:hypothetical protein